MSNKKYAVVIYRNFDTHTPVYLFDDHKTAHRYLCNIFKNEKNKYRDKWSIFSGISIDEEHTYCEENFAQLQYDSGDFSHYILTEANDLT